MASTIGTTTILNSIRIPPQRNSFYAVGRHWVFYCKAGTNNLVYQTSIEGITWGDVVEIASLPSPQGTNYDLCFDGTYVHYARNTGLDSYSRYTGIKYRKGTPQSDGTISWSAAEQTALTGVADYISLCIDSNGYPWMTYGAGYGNSSGNATVTVSFTIDGTWITVNGYPLLLLSGYGYMAFLLPQTNGKMAAVIYAAFDTAKRIQSRFYNGVDMWNAIEYITPDNDYGKLSTYYPSMLCGTAINNKIHLVYKSILQDIQYVQGTN
jgi:hypothetical protein